MEYIELDLVESILKNNISSNKDRFDSVNGIAFVSDLSVPDIFSFFRDYGIEVNDLGNGIFYTETVMTSVEFSNLDHVKDYIVLA